MVKIRLKRLGRKKRPFYRIVVMDSRERRQGAYLAEIGYYNPLSRELKFDKAAVDSWKEKGAQLSPTVARLYDRAPETSADIIVLDREQKERLSKKALERQQKEAAEAKAKADAEAEAKRAKAEADAAAAAAPPEEAPAAEPEAPAAEAAAPGEEAPAAEPETPAAEEAAAPAEA